MNNTHLSCTTPPLPVQDTVIYLLRLDNAPPPDPTVLSFQLSVMPDPSRLVLVTRSVPRGSNSTIVQIDVSNQTPLTMRLCEGFNVSIFLSPRDKI